MARTLFFIEALLFTALGLGGVLAFAGLRAAFLAPPALSLVAPLACALAAWPVRDVAAALRRVFSSRGAMGETAESVHVLEALGAFCGRTAVAGLAFSLAAALPRLLDGGPAEGWALLGAYLALYSLLNTVASLSMAKVASRTAGGPGAGAGAAEGRPAAPAPSAERLASAYGLTPREAEVAALIAGGASYKESAYSLGISLKTIKTHVAHVYEKTGCASNVALSLLLYGAEPPPEPRAGAAGRLIQKADSGNSGKDRR